MSDNNKTNNTPQNTNTNQPKADSKPQTVRINASAGHEFSEYKGNNKK